MSRRLLRDVFRSGAWIAIPLSWALDVPSYVESKNALGANWASTAEVANGSAILIVALSASLSAGIALQWSRHIQMLGALSTRARTTLSRPAILVWAAVLFAHLTWVIFVCLSEAAGTRGDFEWLPFVPVSSALLAGAMVGAMTARVVRTWLAPPLVGIGLYVLLIQLYNSRYSKLMLLGGVDAPLNGIHLRPPLAWTQTAWFLVIAAACFGALVVQFRAPLQVAALSVCSPILLLLTAYLVVSQGPGRFGPMAMEWTCQGDEPRFCVIAEHSSVLDKALPRWEEAARRWRKVLGPSTPPNYWERLDLPVSSHAAEFTLRADDSDEEIVESLVRASFPCAEAWTLEQMNRAADIAQQLAQGGLEHRSGSVATSALPSLAVLRC